MVTAEQTSRRCPALLSVHVLLAAQALQNNADLIVGRGALLTTGRMSLTIYWALSGACLSRYLIDVLSDLLIPRGVPAWQKRSSIGSNMKLWHGNIRCSPQVDAP